MGQVVGSKSTRPRRWVAAAAVSTLAAAGFIAVSAGPASSEAFAGLNGKIVYSQLSPDRRSADLWTMNPDGSAMQQLTESPDGTEDFDPQWSPDGTQVAFQREGGNGDSGDDDSTQVWVVDTDDSDVTQLTFHDDGAFAPSWSPDGSHIVFTAYPDGDGSPGGTALYLMNADGSDQTRLTSDNRGDGWPSWSPDGSQIAFGRYDTQSSAYEVFLVNADGAGLSQLTDNGVQSVMSYGASWSPDGTRLMFLRQVEVDTSIAVMNADGSGQHTLGGMRDGYGHWSPDGQLLAYSSNAQESPGIYTVSPDGSDPTLILAGNDVRDPAWQTLPTPVDPTTTTTTGSTSTTAVTAAAAVTPRFAG